MFTRALMFSAKLLLFAGSALAQDDHPFAKAVRDTCNEEWGADYAMVEYCINTQFEAMDAVRAIHESVENQPVLMDILQTCYREWPDDEGYDWRMVEYCYNRQKEAYERLQQ